MRRTEREMTNPDFMFRVLEDADVVYIAMNASGCPYLLPFNFVLHEKALFIHCAHEGRKWDLLRADPHVAFATAVDIRVEKTTTRYRSVAGTGIASRVEDSDLKDTVLRALAKKFNAPCAFPLLKKEFDRTALIRVSIETMTGKHSRPEEKRPPADNA
ncbi:MAG: pyridoxamine 5'-phosphate oxidase family protein [Desulfovibrio sp.]|jgi:nitroimidazol reductase NimA-like FMN-containing flavoprotein (pyridoxamine 5'-phosphate oxidase superfamily)|nr:pyridoxamine 5'-phosphate oxidase family protein [Desulfovibrio sp.]